MSTSIQALRHLVEYSHEMVADRPTYGEVLDKVTDSAGVQQALETQSLLGIAAMGLLAKQAYDVAYLPDERDLSIRRQAAELGGMLLFATDVVDDEIDRAEMPLDEKERYLNSWTGVLLWGGDRLREARYPTGGNPRSVSLSFDLAEYVHAVTAEYDGVERLTKVIQPLVDGVLGQMTSQDCEEQLELTAMIGAGCGAISSAAVEIATNLELLQATQAAEGFGAYTECLNHACEITEDVNEGSLSYATLYLKLH